MYFFFQVIDRWEKVIELILKREDLLVKFEKFERVVLDLNRFFEKGSFFYIIFFFSNQCFLDRKFFCFLMFVIGKLKYFQRNSLLMWVNGYLYGEIFKEL